MTQTTKELIDRHRMHSHLLGQKHTPAAVLKKCDAEMSGIEETLKVRAVELNDEMAGIYISLLQGRV